MRSTPITLSMTKARTLEATRPLTLILATPRPRRSAPGMERSASHEPYRRPGELSSKSVSLCLNPPLTSPHRLWFASGRNGSVWPVLRYTDLTFLWGTGERMLHHALTYIYQLGEPNAALR